MRRHLLTVLCSAAALGGLAGTAHAAPSPAGTIVDRSAQREAEYRGDDYQRDAIANTLVNALQAVGGQLSDPVRLYLASLCGLRYHACGGDHRLYSFEERGRGLSRPVLFTARNGSTISGHVWATKAGPPKRPLVVITNGSIQATEQMYWWAAQTLAKAGYVVLTSDPAGQGQSDLLGSGPDLLEGVHSQVAGNTFYDGTQDALDFALSSPEQPFCPRPSRGGTSHCEKQRSRAGRGITARFNPFHDLVDPSRVGLAGHSYGAAGVSYIAQLDERVDAVVAWDALCDPSSEDGGCLRGGAGGTVGLRVPALNMTADSFLGLEALGGPPGDAGAKAAASRRYSAKGIDTGSIVIRGGTHFEWSYLPFQVFRATLRGIDLSAWYTVSWFDKYVKGDPTADRRLLTGRWRDDAADAAVDPTGGNLFSDWSTSRLDIRRSDGSRATCEDLRAGCDALAADDGEPAGWRFLPVATAPDGTPAFTAASEGAPGTAPRLSVRAGVLRRAARRRATVRVLLRAPVGTGGRTTVDLAAPGARIVGARRRTVTLPDTGRARALTVRLVLGPRAHRRGAVRLRVRARPQTGAPRTASLVARARR